MTVLSEYHVCVPVYSLRGMMYCVGRRFDGLFSVTVQRNRMNFCVVVADSGVVSGLDLCLCSS